MLQYEHDFLKELGLASWRRNIESPESIANRPEDYDRSPGAGASERDWRAYWRNFPPRHQCRTSQLEQAFSIYQRQCAEQDHVRQSGFFSETLAKALERLPNLTTINMPALGRHSRYQTEVWALLQVSYNPARIESDNLPIIRSLILAVEQAAGNIKGGNDEISGDPQAKNQGQTNQCTGSAASGNGQSGLRIRNLSLGSFDWRMLQQDEVLAAMKKSIHYLTHLDMHFINDRRLKGHIDYSAIPNDTWAATECMEKGRLVEFLTSAPNLDELNISFDACNSDLNTNLRDIVGTFYWASLKTVHFRLITVTENNLTNFCKRHSATLTNLSLGDIHLRGRIGDSWYSIFWKIRRATKLEMATVYGTLDAGSRWEMDDYQDTRRKTGTLVGRYLVGCSGNDHLGTFLQDERFREAEERQAESRRRLYNVQYETLPARNLERPENLSGFFDDLAGVI